VVTQAAAPAGVKPAGVLPHLDQDLLGDLFGLRHITHHGAGRAEHRRDDVLADGLERVPVALGHPAEQRRQLRPARGARARSGAGR